MKKNNVGELKAMKEMIKVVEEAFTKSNTFDANELYHVFNDGFMERAQYWANIGRKAYAEYEYDLESCRPFFDESNEFEKLSEQIAEIYFTAKGV